MDSNVSKNTFCQKLLKLALIPDILAIGKVLKQHLILTIKAYSSLHHPETEFALIESLVTDKLVLCDFNRNFSLAIIYRCAIAFPLANYWQQQPLTIAQNLREFLLTTNVISTTQPILRFSVRVVFPGWLDFYMSDRALAVWLEEVIKWIRQDGAYKSATQVRGTAPPQGNVHQDRGSGEQMHFWSIQYAHARCCSLLRLGDREKLIKIKHELSEWTIVEPIDFSWVDARGIFLLVHPTEKYLLIQLLTVVEQLIDPSKKVNWAKLAQNLSTVFLDFWAECRIFGEVPQKTPDLAQARLRLVALVQYFLDRILRDKLYVIPLTEI